MSTYRLRTMHIQSMRMPSLLVKQYRVQKYTGPTNMFTQPLSTFKVPDAQGLFPSYNPPEASSKIISEAWSHCAPRYIASIDATCASEITSYSNVARH